MDNLTPKSPKDWLEKMKIRFRSWILALFLVVEKNQITASHTTAANIFLGGVLMLTHYLLAQTQSRDLCSQRERKIQIQIPRLTLAPPRWKFYGLSTYPPLRTPPRNKALLTIGVSLNKALL